MRVRAPVEALLDRAANCTELFGFSFRQIEAFVDARTQICNEGSVGALQMAN